jgi:hypothetical protein
VVSRPSAVVSGRSAALLLLFALAAAPRPGGDGGAADDGERYRVLTAALARGEYARAHELAAGFAAGSPLAMKAAQLEMLAPFLAAGAKAPASAMPAAPRGVAMNHLGALSIALSDDGAFAAAVRPEAGATGFAPLLFGFPQPVTSRLSVSIDGSARMLSPRGGPRGLGDGLALSAREGDVEVLLALHGAAPRADEANVAERATLRIEAVVTNRGGAPHRVGARLLLDLVEGFDDAPEVRFGERRVVDRTADFTGDAVPGVVRVGGRTLALRGLGAPAPDRVLLVPLPATDGKPFDFAVTNDAPLGPDSALAIYADEAELAPGQSRALTVAFGAEPAASDTRGPVATRAWLEPAAGGEARRAVLSLENSLNGAIGACDDLRVDYSLTPGLDLVAAPDDLARLGSLPRDVTLQRSVVVRPNLSSGGPLAVRFDVSTKSSGGERSHKLLDVPVPAPPASFLAGRILDVQGRPIAGAELSLEENGQVVQRGGSDGAGNYRFGGVGPGLWQVRATKVIWVEPAAKANREDVENVLYDVVLTSAAIGNDGREALPAFTPGSGRDVVMARSITRYSLYCCTEWDAPRAYLEEIVRGLRHAAEFLYSASDGQITFKRVAVVDDGLNWNTSDLWDWACNHIHPNATVNGTRQRYDPVYSAWNSAINFGRDWNGPWDAHGHFSTIVHEFGHYGLGLYDEYLGAPQGVYRGLAYWEMCRCIMGYQYADWKICWAGNHQPYTNQGMWNGRSCWQQIQEWHQGLRGGLFAPITTPLERGGVVPPSFENHVGDELTVVIRDAQTHGFDAALRVAGLGESNRSNVLVYTEQQHDGRTLYQGVTWGDGSMKLMGVHVGDKVWGLRDGARAEFRVNERRGDYVLDFDTEPGPDAPPTPLVRVHPERTGARDAGAAVEITTFVAPSGPPTLKLRGSPRPIALDLVPPEPNVKPGGASERFVAHFAESDFAAGRLALELLLPDATRGDRTIVTDVVRAPMPAVAESELASFDGSLRLHFAPGALATATPFCIASTAGPPRFVEGRRSLGRFHAIESGDGAPFRAPATLVLHVPAPADRARVELRRFDEATHEFVVLRSEPAPEPDALLASLDGPAVVALFEK